MDTNKKIRDYISAFADGELPDADLELALAALREPDGRETWSLYHRIGDALRAEPSTAELSPGFEACLASKLAAEPLPLRRGAGKPALPTDELAAIAPAVVAAGVESLGGAKAAGQPLAVKAMAPSTAHESATLDAGPAAVKRV